VKVIKTYELVEPSTRGERKEFAGMLAFAQAQNETVAIVADAVDRFQRSFKESLLMEGTIIGKGASSMVKKRVAEMLSGMGLDEYTVEDEAIRRISSLFEQIDRMLASLKARRITSARAREIAQAEFDVAEIDARSGMELDPAERSAISSSRVGSSHHTLRVTASISRTFQRLSFNAYHSQATSFRPKTRRLLRGCAAARGGPC
jgi:galactitol-specific phosphotransferase system IIB component